MTIEIKQADREALAASFERHRHQEIANWVRSVLADESTHRPALYALATQRSTYEVRIAELERERDALRTMAINHLWNWNLSKAYGEKEYRRQLEDRVDATLQNMLAVPAARFIQETEW